MRYDFIREPSFLLGENEFYGETIIENELKRLLDKYEVSIDEIQNDLQDCFDTLVDNNLATYD